MLAMTLFMISSVMLTTMFMMNLSTASTMVILVSLVTVSAVIFKTFLFNEWSSILLFLALIGGLMILFSFFMSTLPKENNSVSKFSLWPMLPTLGFMMYVTEFPQGEKSIKTLFSMNISIPFSLMVILIFLLLIASKIIINPIKPFKSNI